MSNIIGKVLKEWGGKLWKKEKYLELHPTVISAEDWENEVIWVLNEKEKSLKENKPFSDRISQVRLYKIFHGIK